MTYDINLEQIDPAHIAVIGMSGAFPGASSIDVFWSNLLQGKELISDLSEQECIDAGIAPSTLASHNYVKRAAYIDEAKYFDAQFFGYSDAEAALLDPQHRLLLQHAWAALESAGYIPDQVDGLVAVYAGCGFNRYLLDKMEINTKDFSLDDFQKMIANDKDFLATRISHKLNLSGPSLTVQTACSTSLVAIQMGCTALQTYQADVALCGGVSINVPHGAGYLHTEGMIFSPTGVCKPFDADANGTVFGEGVGVVALKRLEDAIADNDPIIAVVTGAAINNDGNKKVGYTAPSADGQTEVVKFAHSIAEIDAHQVDYIETHGTATALGDPIEIVGLKSVFGPAEKKHCALGTLKANIGHLDAAAGVASFIKAALVVRDKRIPPNIHLDKLHPAIDLMGTPFYLNTSTVEIDKESVIAGVSAFGVGGTNAHVILQSPPERATQKSANSQTICVLTAKKKQIVEQYKSNVKKFIGAYPDRLAELSHTLFSSRSVFEYRSFLSAYPNPDSSIYLENNVIYRAKSKPNIAILFPGQGAEFEGMAAAYYEQSDIFRQHFDHCIKIFSTFSSYDLRKILLSSEKNDEIHLTQYAQPALFIVEYCIWQILAHCKIKPDVMLGHSLGQYVAACVAGIFSVNDAIKLVVRRGEIMAKASAGGMIAVFCDKEQLLPLLSENIDIAAINSPKRTVVSGDKEEINLFLEILEKNNIEYRKLRVSHGFHSRSMDQILAPFRMAFDGISLGNPEAVILATSEENVELNDKEYWVRHLRDSVNFSHAVKRLDEYNIDTCIEVGPGKALSIFITDQLDASNLNIVSTLLKQDLSQERNYYFQLLGTLWCCGVNSDLRSKNVIPSSQRIAVPTYPFEQKEYWLPSKSSNNGDQATKIVGEKASTLTLIQEIEQAWSETFSIDKPNHSDNFFDLGGDSFIGIQLANKLSTTLNTSVAIADIIRHPSIAQLHVFFSSTIALQSDNSFDIVFCLDKRGSAPPLFLVSGAHDDVYSETHQSNYEKDAYRYFGTLVKHLGHTRPIYGFRPQGILYGEKFLSSVEEMATQNIKHMKTIQAQGPYLIGGECVGGLISLEMSRQLIEAGEQVKHVILMDTVFPSFSFRLKEGLLVRYRRIKRACISAFVETKNLQLKKLFQHLYTCLKLSIIYIFPFTNTMKNKRNTYFGSQKYLDLLLKYKPYDINNKIHLISNEQWAKKTHRLGWQKADWPNFEFIIVKGDHQSRLTEFGPELGQLILRIANEDLEVNS